MSTILSYFVLLAGIFTTQTNARGQAFSPTFPYGVEKVRGVNLGGWLLLEPFITPQLFDATGNPDIVDEPTFCKYQDREVAEAALRQHWDTFITEQDIADIAKAGLNHVRLPVGFWAFDVSSDECYITGQKEYLIKAVGWAKKYGLKVIADLHDVPGSVNGFYSQDGANWYHNKTDIDRSKKIMSEFAQMFANETDVVTAIATINEPTFMDKPGNWDTLEKYWLDSYDLIRYPNGRSGESGNITVLIYGSTDPVHSLTNFMTPPAHQGVAVDMHIYQVFDQRYQKMTFDEHIRQACTAGGNFSRFDLPVIIGEWSPAVTDCPKYFNGRHVGSRWEGIHPNSTRIGSCEGWSGSASTFSEDYKTFLRKYWEAQVISYEKGAGWVQWLWKSGGTSDDWSYQAGLQHGWIPSHPTNLKYPDICNP